MTNYVNAIYPFEITIAPSATSASYNLPNSLVGKGVIFLGGVEYDDNGLGTVLSEACVRVALATNTVTATRNTGTTSRIKVRGVVLDGDATNLIDTVQYLTNTLGSGTASGTSAITAIDQTRSVVHHLGCSTTSTGSSENNIATRLSFASNSSVQVDRESTSAAVTTGILVIQFKAAAIQSLQAFSQNLVTTKLSDTLTLGTAIVNTNAILIDAGTSTNTSTRKVFRYQKRITGNTQLTFNREGTATSSRTLNGYVVEFVAGVLAAMQRHQLTANQVTTNQAPITVIDPAFSITLFGGYSTTALNTQEGTASIKTVGVSLAEIDRGASSAGSLTTGAYEIATFSGGSGANQFSVTSPGLLTISEGAVTVDQGPNASTPVTGFQMNVGLGQVTASTPTVNPHANWEDQTGQNWEAWNTLWEDIVGPTGVDVTISVTSPGLLALQFNGVGTSTSIAVNVIVRPNGLGATLLFNPPLASVDVPVDKGATNAERTYTVPPPLNNRTYTVLIA